MPANPLTSGKRFARLKGSLMTSSGDDKMDAYQSMLEWLRWIPVENRVHRYKPWLYDKSISPPKGLLLKEVKKTMQTTQSPFGASQSADVLIGHLRACKTEQEIAEFAGMHGLDMELWHSAPNKGVGKMRLINALKNRKQ